MDTASLQSVLWDIAPGKIDTLEDDFIIRRILTYGTIPLVMRTIAYYGYTKVAQEFSTLQETSMDRRRYRYLSRFVFAASL